MRRNAPNGYCVEDVLMCFSCYFVECTCIKERMEKSCYFRCFAHCSICFSLTLSLSDLPYSHLLLLDVGSIVAQLFVSLPPSLSLYLSFSGFFSLSISFHFSFLGKIQTNRIFTHATSTHHKQAIEYIFLTSSNKRVTEENKEPTKSRHV